MEDQKESKEDQTPNSVPLLQKHHSKPLSSHQTYLYPAVQPGSASEARGENPWTGQTADEVREASYSEHQYKRQQQEKQAVTNTESRKDQEAASAPVSPPDDQVEKAMELDEMMFDTAM